MFNWRGLQIESCIRQLTILNANTWIRPQQKVKKVIMASKELNVKHKIISMAGEKTLRWMGQLFIKKKENRLFISG